MGKKSRRRDKERGAPLSAEEREREDHKEAIVVRQIEEGDPSYRHFDRMPKKISRIVVKHRFGGETGPITVKINAAIVIKIREARALSGRDAFEGEQEIWEVYRGDGPGVNVTKAMFDTK